jgi:hypothetical protein
MEWCSNRSTLQVSFFCRVHLIILFSRFLTENTVLFGAAETERTISIIKKNFIRSGELISENKFVLVRAIRGYLGRYSDSLRAGRSGDRIPVGARFSAPVQTGPGAHPASCTMGTGAFPGVKRPGRGV